MLKRLINSRLKIESKNLKIVLIKSEKKILNFSFRYVCDLENSLLSLHSIQHREMAEWSNAAVLKTVDCQRSGGSNPSLSAKKIALSKGYFFTLNVKV
jgi:hypothetical protein